MAASFNPTPSTLSSTRAYSRAAPRPRNLLRQVPSPSPLSRSPPLSSFHFNRQSLSILPISSSSSSSLPTLKLHCVRESRAPAVTQSSWEREVLKSETPVLVEFYASWCGPCKMVDRMIDEIASEYAGKLKCVVLNVDENSKVVEDYEVKAVPVVLLFKNGKQREIVAGTMPKEFFVAAIERVLKS